MKVAGDLLAGGAEPPSTTTLWILLYMVHFPEVQERCYQVAGPFCSFYGVCLLVLCLFAGLFVCLLACLSVHLACLKYSVCACLFVLQQQRPSNNQPTNKQRPVLLVVTEL